MSDVETKDVVKDDLVVREYTEDELTRTFTISVEAYKILMEVVDEADSRGLNSSAQFWLERLTRQHAKVTMGLWKKADDVSIFTQAQRGSKSAQVALLASLGIKGEDAKELLKKIGK